MAEEEEDSEQEPLNLPGPESELAKELQEDRVQSKEPSHYREAGVAVEEAVVAVVEAVLLMPEEELQVLQVKPHLSHLFPF